jgi:hypothetical protein
MADVKPKRAAVSEHVVVDSVTLKCDKPSVTLRPGDRVTWSSDADIVVDFGDKSPFTGGQFRRNQPATVRDGAKPDTYKPVISLVGGSKSESDPEGDVIVERPTGGG